MEREDLFSADQQPELRGLTNDDGEKRNCRDDGESFGEELSSDLHPINDSETDRTSKVSTEFSHVARSTKPSSHPL